MAYYTEELADMFAQQTSDDFEIPLSPRDDWPSKDDKMALPKSVSDQILDKSDVDCPGYRNTQTPWWDGS